MGCLNIGLEKLKIVHKVTLHLSFSAPWQPAEREQTTSLFLNNEGDAGRALTFTEMFSFFVETGKEFKLLIQTIPLLKCQLKACRHIATLSQHSAVKELIKSNMEQGLIFFAVNTSSL